MAVIVNHGNCLTHKSDMVSAGRDFYLMLLCNLHEILEQRRVVKDENAEKKCGNQKAGFFPGCGISVA
jgi:hypothetical protein